jgi:hypothetical protein
LVHAITPSRFVPSGKRSPPLAFFAALESTLHWALANANQRKHSPPTCALHKVGRQLRYFGRAAHVIGTAVRDPKAASSLGLYPRQADCVAA